MVRRVGGLGGRAAVGVSHNMWNEFPALSSAMQGLLIFAVTSSAKCMIAVNLSGDRIRAFTWMPNYELPKQRG